MLTLGNKHVPSESQSDTFPLDHLAVQSDFAFSAMADIGKNPPEYTFSFSYLLCIGGAQDLKKT